MLTAIVYAGLHSHYNEPKAYLLNRQRPGEQSQFPTNPGDLVDIVSTWVPSTRSAKGLPKTLAMTQLDSIAKSTEKKSGKLPPTKVDLCSKIIFLYSLVEEPVILDGDLPFLFTRHAKRIG